MLPLWCFESEIGANQRRGGRRELGTQRQEVEIGEDAAPGDTGNLLRILFGDATDSVGSTGLHCHRQRTVEGMDAAIESQLSKKFPPVQTLCRELSRGQ